MNKITKLTESNDNTTWKVIKFSPRQQHELFEELSQKEFQKFTAYDFGFRFFANTPWATAKEARQLFNVKLVPWWGLEQENKKHIFTTIKWWKNLRLSDYYGQTW